MATVNDDVQHNIPPEERFWSYVCKAGVDECWLWLGEDVCNGYGRFRPRHNGKLIRAHRYSYELTYGAIPDEMDVCHTCDNRLCVNPNHLFVGTHSDNMIDASKKGRTCKFSAETCKTVVLLATMGVKQKDLAERFGMSRAHVSAIITGRKRGYLNEPAL